MKLYSVIGSHNCRKVEAVIDQLVVDIEIEYLELTKGDLSTPSFLKINPNGKVPVLVDGAFVLWESNAIMQYLCDQSSDESLLPSSPQTRADICRWQFWEVTHFNKAFATIAFETILKQNILQKPANQALVDNAIDNLSQFSSVLNQRMADREFVVGNDITLADYSLTSLEGFKQAIPFDWSNYPYVNEYFERMRSNKHWAATDPQKLAASA